MQRVRLENMFQWVSFKLKAVLSYLTGVHYVVIGKLRINMPTIL